MSNTPEAIDSIYDAKTGRLRDLGGEPVTPENLPRKGDLVQHPDGAISPARIDWSVGSIACGEPCRILRRKQQSQPYLGDCARCGGDHFDQIEWKELQHPHGDYTHWAPCPTNGEPILMRVTEAHSPERDQE